MILSAFTIYLAPKVAPRHFECLWFAACHGEHLSRSVSL